MPQVRPVRLVVVLVGVLALLTINGAAQHDSASLIVRADLVGGVCGCVVGAVIFGVQVAVKPRQANERRRAGR